MDARTECEVEQMNSEYSIRIPEKTILEFLEDYTDSDVVGKLLFLKKYWGTDSIVETIIDCIGYAESWAIIKLDNEDIFEAVQRLKKHCQEHKCNNCRFGYKNKHCTLAFRPSSWSIKIDSGGKADECDNSKDL